jgi:hypothetical protein
MNVPQYLYGDIVELQRYISLLTQAMQSDLSDNGWQAPQLSTANVMVITDATFTPVMRAGTFWFNTDLMKMQFITVKADPTGPTNASIETITSA